MMMDMELPPVLTGDVQQQLRQLREYLLRTAMRLSEEQAAPQQVINQTQTVKKGTAPFVLDESQFLKIYPVGSIYLSVSQTDPATLFGGTWQRIKDRFLLAAGSTYAAGATGGAATHKLTVNEMPSHTHIVSNYASMVGWSGSSPSKSYLNNTNDGYVGSSNPKSKTTGGSAAHNNMPPYLAVYVWKRTA